MRKKLLVALLAISMIATMMPVIASAAARPDRELSDTVKVGETKVLTVPEDMTIGKYIDSYQWYIQMTTNKENEYPAGTAQDDILGPYTYLKKIDGATQVSYSVTPDGSDIYKTYYCRAKYNDAGADKTMTVAFKLTVLSAGLGTEDNPIKMYNGDTTIGMSTVEGVSSPGSTTINSDEIYFQFKVDSNMVDGDVSPAIEVCADNLSTLELYNKKDMSNNLLAGDPLYRSYGDNNYAAYLTTTKKFSITPGEDYIIKATFSSRTFTSADRQFKATLYRTNLCDAHGHAWDEGTVTKAPTADEQGTKKYTCTVCGNTKEEPMAPLNSLSNLENAFNTLKQSENAGLTNSIVYSLNGDDADKVLNAIAKDDPEDISDRVSVGNDVELTNVDIVGVGVNGTNKILQVRTSDNEEALENIVTSQLDISTDADKLIVVSMQLGETNVATNEELKLVKDGQHGDAEPGIVPVIISFDIPDGIDPDKLIVIHKKSGQVAAPNELIVPTISTDKKTASIVVTHFSDFVIAEATEAVVNKPSVANTADSNDIALFSILGLLALAGAGYTYKRRSSCNL